MAAHPAAQRMADRKLTLTWTDAALDNVASDGHDSAYGARPLKRLIQQYIENPLAKRILDGQFDDGDAIQLDVRGDRFEFRSAPIALEQGSNPL